VGEQRRIELINETLKCISLQTKLASLCKSINKINDDCLRAEQERDKLKAENEKLKGELNLLERSHEQRNGGEMIQDKLCITITETANGKAEYVQIISGDQVSVNVVLIADKIEINDARSTKVKSK
jgi:septal ring factor EnvC (AmiA/AmiB activator)